MGNVKDRQLKNIIKQFADLNLEPNSADWHLMFNQILNIQTEIRKFFETNPLNDIAVIHFDNKEELKKWQEMSDRLHHWKTSKELEDEEFEPPTDISYDQAIDFIDEMMKLSVIQPAPCWVCPSGDGGISINWENKRIIEFTSDGQIEHYQLQNN